MMIGQSLDEHGEVAMARTAAAELLAERQSEIAVGSKRLVGVLRKRRCLLPLFELFRRRCALQQF